MEKILLVAFLLSLSALVHAVEIDEIHIYKAKHQMSLLSQGKVIKTYQIMLGRGGLAPKRKEGDKLVPEGNYVVDYKNPMSQFYKALHLSYPNEADIKRAEKEGVDPGMDIMIHGYPNKQNSYIKLIIQTGAVKFLDWTSGCIAIDNREMDFVYENTAEYTPVKIFK